MAGGMRRSREDAEFNGQKRARGGRERREPSITILFTFRR